VRRGHISRPAHRAGSAPGALPQGAWSLSRRRALPGSAAVWLASALLATNTATARPSSSQRFDTVSSNWAGYAVSGPSVRFKTVSAQWVQPSVTCAGRPGYSGFWVGLGGYHQTSNALEQIGTEADCSASGGADYFAWYELVPKSPVDLRLAIRPGDRIATSVTVSGQHVRLALRDLTTRASYVTTQRASAIDVSSAEWIAEAPSVCYGQSCHVLPLANFGSVAFSAVSATATNGHKGSISDSAWSPTALELLGFSGGLVPARFGRPATAATATPTALTAAGSAFTVGWQQTSAPPETPAPVGPYPG
jgi:Peptidase A4 family